MKYLQTFKKKLFAGITHVPAIVQGSYYPALNGLRGIAILMVILYHFGANHFFRPLHFLVNGQLGVNIFFVISGFLITTLLLKEKLKHGQISLKRFYIRRILKILPSAYLFLLVLIIFNTAYRLNISGPNFLASFLFYKNIPYQTDPYSGHFWSLAAEVQFYLICPLLLASNINRYMLILIAIVVLVPIISVLGFYHIALYSNPVLGLITQFTMYFFWKGLFVILIGSLSAVLLFKGVIVIADNKTNYFLSFLLLLLAITISNTTFLFYSKYVSEFLSAILISWVILLNLKKHDFLSAILQNPVLVKTGILSYSLYIWQQLFIGTRRWQFWLTPFRTYPLAVLIPIKLISVFAIAFASYYLIERRFLRIKDDL